MLISGILEELNFKDKEISHIFINIVTILIIYLIVFNCMRLIMRESEPSVTY